MITIFDAHGNVLDYLTGKMVQEKTNDFDWETWETDANDSGLPDETVNYIIANFADRRRGAELVQNLIDFKTKYTLSTDDVKKLFDDGWIDYDFDGELPEYIHLMEDPDDIIQQIAEVQNVPMDSSFYWYVGNNDSESQSDFLRYVGVTFAALPSGQYIADTSDM